jgi:hypothetical protein
MDSRDGFWQYSFSGACSIQRPAMPFLVRSEPASVYAFIGGAWALPRRDPFLTERFPRNELSTDRADSPPMSLWPFRRLDPLGNCRFTYYVCVLGRSGLDPEWAYRKCSPPTTKVIPLRLRPLAAVPYHSHHPSCSASTGIQEVELLRQAHLATQAQLHSCSSWKCSRTSLFNALHAVSSGAKFTPRSYTPPTSTLVLGPT